MPAIIGSRGLSEHYPDIEYRDVDIIATLDEAENYLNRFRVSKNKPRVFYPESNGKKIITEWRYQKLCPAGTYKTVAQPVEIEIAWKGSTAAWLLELLKEDYLTHKLDDSVYYFHDVMIPSAYVLYTLKMSHRYLKNSPHFLKTMKDIYWFREKGFGEIPDRYKEWFKAREEETYNYSHPNLNQNKKDFFNPEEVKYTYDHDSIHRAVAHLDEPAYNKFKKDTAEVAVSKKKFMSLPEQIQLYSVVEEAYVLAIERSQVPFPGVLTPRESFEKALEKICTSISSGWWREFAWENYYKALALYDENYINKFWQAVKDGRVPLAN